MAVQAVGPDQFVVRPVDADLRVRRGSMAHTLYAASTMLMLPHIVRST